VNGKDLKAYKRPKIQSLALRINNGEGKRGMSKALERDREVERRDCFTVK
jgi:hypothetical protein